MVPRSVILAVTILLLVMQLHAGPIIELTDPKGDDHGDGNFVYPSQGFHRGDLDLVGFTVENDGDDVVFTVEFARRINKPKRGAADELGTDFLKIARHGFYQFNVDVYVDTDRRYGSGYTRLLPGRLATVAPDDAWDAAVIAAPRPLLIKGMLRSLLKDELVDLQQDEDADNETANRARVASARMDRVVHFATDYRVRGKRLRFTVPQSALGGPAQDTWAYTVLVTGADLQASLQMMSATGLSSTDNGMLGVLPISPGEEWTNRFGGGRSGEPLQPPIVDLIVPRGEEQETVLSDYSSRQGRPAVLPAVVPAAFHGGGEGTLTSAEPRWLLDHWRGKVGYEIFVRSFKDSDGDGIGDFNGLVEKLDALNDGDPDTDTDLGIEALWLMPIFASPSYHGYDAIDYYRVNPDYGTDEDFDRLLKECHRRGIAVVLDLMLNHSSSQHPWFVESARGPASDKRDWYIWRADDPSWTQPWGGSWSTWHESGDAYYYGIFWGGMPDLNFRNPAVMAEARKIARFWLQRGVDGFRLDAARHLIEAGPGEQQNDTPETHAAWREFSAFMRREFPDRLMLGEIWSGPEDVASYYGDAVGVPGGDEFAMAFDFTLAEGMIQAVNLGDKGPLTAALARIRAAYPEGVLDGTFLANHDMTRLATQIGDNQQKAAQAAALLLTLPGTPWLYYGEEVGLHNPRPGGDEEKRTPMPWSDDDQGFTSGVPWHEFAPGRETANVAAQTDDPESLFSRYRKLIRLRQNSPALQTGDLTVIELDNSGWGAVAYLRQAAGQRVFVVHNLSNDPTTVGWSLPESASGYTLLFGDRGVGLPAGDALTLPGRATGVWELQP